MRKNKTSYSSVIRRRMMQDYENLKREVRARVRREIYTHIIIILLVLGPLIFLGFFDV
jgi:hypothetical protein